MTVNIHQQIEWLEQQIKSMHRSLPKALESGRISQEHATHKMACAEATLQTMTQLRGIVRAARRFPMPDKIVSVDAMRERARAAFAAGKPLADCPLPWHSAARVTWESEYALLTAQACPPSHAAPTARQRIEQEQEA